MQFSPETALSLAMFEDFGLSFAAPVHWQIYTFLPLVFFL
jgi:hypothetical protein